LGDLTEQAPASSNAPEYARIIFDMSQRRDLIHLCQEMGGAAMRDRETPAFSLAAELRAEAEIIESASAPEDATMIAAPALAEKTLASLRTLMQEGKPRGRMTGLRCFDRRLGGLKPGSLVVIGGRPSMGKTSLARAALHGAAVRSPDHTFLFLSIEMGDEEMMQRELAAMSHDVGEGIEYRAMGSGKITPFDMMVLERLRHPANLVFDDCASAPSLDDVRRKIWSKARKGKVGAVVIDYLQLMRRPEARGRNEASVLGEMTMGLKHLARQAETCIILLSQLSRQVEQRDDKKPQLSDLRDSGSIEQDADAVLFPFREFYYVERAKPADSAKSDRKLEWDIRCEELRRKLEVICAKQRQGPAGYDLQRYFAEFDHIADEGADQ
jgi:replicative DNA helicase